MGRITLDKAIPEKHCKKCGKLFIPAPEHIYRKGNVFYCSWTCYLHRDDNLEVKKKDDKGTT